MFNSNEIAFFKVAIKRKFNSASIKCIFIVDFKPRVYLGL